jgi:hypothetical protein
MQILTRRAVAAAALTLMAATSVAWAQGGPPVRIRGEITKVEGSTVSIKSRTGEALTVKLAEPLRVNAMVKGSLADIKEGSFIGVSAMPQPDGTQKAYAIHIFLDAQKGVVPDSFNPNWDNRPGSTMTNANVATTVVGKDGQEILVKYKDGEKKVLVPAGIPIAKYAAGGAEDLKVGAKVFIGGARKQDDGTFAAPNIAVGRDIDPPQ